MATAGTHETSCYVKGGRVVDPRSKRDEISDLFINNGLVAPLPASPPPGTCVIDAKGLIVAPGLIDLHVHLREPGGEEAETIASGSAAAARGGFTTIVSMPNTNPPIDCPEKVGFVRRRSAECGLVRVLPSGCITINRTGLQAADLEGMAAAGAAAFTDDGATVADAAVMRSAMKIAGQLGLPVMDHALDPVLAGRGVMHEGARAHAIKLQGIPSAAETSIVSRDIELSAETGCAIHIQHVSTAGSIEAIRHAIARGVPVTCEVTPHHLALCDTDVSCDDTYTKVSPPLGSTDDRNALRAAVAQGVVQALATDHAPHTEAAKRQDFARAPFGMIGLETAVGVTYTTLVKTRLISLAEWLGLWTTGPARVINMPMPGLANGCPADIVLLDLDSEWTVRTDGFASKSRNSPFIGRKLTGSAVLTMLGGRITWNSDPARIDKSR